MTHFGIEDYTLLKLMEEIQEINDEISLKQKQIQNRMLLMKRILEQSENNVQKREMIEKFLLKLQDEHKMFLKYEPASPEGKAQDGKSEEVKENPFDNC